MNQRVLNPAELQVLIHYYYGSELYNDGRPWSETIHGAHKAMSGLGMLTVAGGSRGQIDSARITDRGTAHVEALMRVPLPVSSQVWITKALDFTFEPKP